MIHVLFRRRTFIGKLRPCIYSTTRIETVSKFYYGGILKKNFAYEIKRPKKDKKLPVILSRVEISQMLSSVSNIKHRAILMLTYSAGLRVSEVVKLGMKISTLKESSFT
ncbi:MAG: hypothetical protein SCH70_05785 [Candidatus Methanoperedens sp.]|nr:hypothetical protein [Candidatus Methanoperedens sp.]